MRCAGPVARVAVAASTASSNDSTPLSSSTFAATAVIALVVEPMRYSLRMPRSSRAQRPCPRYSNASAKCSTPLSTTANAMRVVKRPFCSIRRSTRSRALHSGAASSPGSRFIGAQRVCEKRGA